MGINPNQKLEVAMNERFGGDWTKMSGTEETYEYVVLCATPLGRVGVRPLGNDMYRVRVEPASDTSRFPTLTREEGWKQPGDNNQPRYSCEQDCTYWAWIHACIGAKALEAGKFKGGACQTIVNPAIFGAAVIDPDLARSALRPLRRRRLVAIAAALGKPPIPKRWNAWKIMEYLAPLQLPKA